MYKQIGHLLREQKDEKLDEKFIKDVFEIMIFHDNLEYFVNKLTFDNGEHFGLFDGENRSININIERINGLERSNYSKRLNALLILRHEIEHAKNLKKTIISDGIESVILELSMFVDNLNVDDEKYRELWVKAGVIQSGVVEKSSIYGLNPNERIADIRSLKFMVNLLKNNRNSQELIQSRKYLYEAYVRGYFNTGSKIDPPTYLYLIKSGFLRYYSNLANYISSHRPYSLDTRVLCGLPITKEEKELTLLSKAGLKEIPKK